MDNLTDEELWKFLATEVMGYTITDGGVVIDGKWSGSWNPLAKQKLWQMFECAEKTNLIMEIKLIAGTYLVAIHLHNESLAKSNESLPHAIANALWEALDE